MVNGMLQGVLLALLGVVISSNLNECYALLKIKQFWIKFIVHVLFHQWDYNSDLQLRIRHIY